MIDYTAKTLALLNMHTGLVAEYLLDTFINEERCAAIAQEMGSTAGPGIFALIVPTDIPISLQLGTLVGDDPVEGYTSPIPREDLQDYLNEMTGNAQFAQDSTALASRCQRHKQEYLSIVLTHQWVAVLKVQLNGGRFNWVNLLPQNHLVFWNDAESIRAEFFRVFGVEAVMVTGATLH